MPADPRSGLDVAFDALAAVLVQVTIPRERDAAWVQGSVSLGFYSEQCSADDEAGTLTYFYSPGYLQGLTDFTGYCVGFGAQLTLPDTPRGQQLRDHLPRWVLDAMNRPAPPVDVVHAS